jgi:hypothetical protein
LIENLVYFNILTDEQIEKIYSTNAILLAHQEVVMDTITKIKAGRKIAKFVKENLDDEFEMKPMRTKIDLNKIKRLIKEEKE